MLARQQEFAFSAGELILDNLTRDLRLERTRLQFRRQFVKEVANLSSENFRGTGSGCLIRKRNRTG